MPNMRPARRNEGTINIRHGQARRSNVQMHKARMRIQQNALLSANHSRHSNPGDAKMNITIVMLLSFLTAIALVAIDFNTPEETFETIGKINKFNVSAGGFFQSTLCTITFDNNTTKVLLDETDKGYQYKIKA